MSDSRKRYRDEDGSGFEGSKRAKLTQAVDMKEFCSHLASAIHDKDQQQVQSLLDDLKHQIGNLSASDLEIFVLQCIEEFQLEVHDNLKMDEQQSSDAKRLKELTASDAYKQDIINSFTRQLAEALTAHEALKGKCNAAMSELAACSQQLAQLLENSEFNLRKAKECGKLNFKLQVALKKTEDALQKSEATAKLRLEIIERQQAELSKLPSTEQVTKMLEQERRQAIAAAAVDSGLIQQLKEANERLHQENKMVLSQKEALTIEVAALRAEFKDPIIDILHIRKKPSPGCFIAANCPAEVRAKTGELCWFGKFIGPSVKPFMSLIEYYEESKIKPDTYIKSPGCHITAVISDGIIFSMDRLPCNQAENVQFLAFLSKNEPVSTSGSAVILME